MRFIGQTDHAANPQFWSPWVTKVAQWLQEERSPVVFLHTPDNARAPEQARAFYADVRSVVRELEPLPEAQLADRQISAFD